MWPFASGIPGAPPGYSRHRRSSNVALFPTFFSPTHFPLEELLDPGPLVPVPMVASLFGPSFAAPRPSHTVLVELHQIATRHPYSPSHPFQFYSVPVKGVSSTLYTWLRSISDRCFLNLSDPVDPTFDFSVRAP